MTATDLAPPVMAIGAWTSNAELIADLFRLGYLDDDMVVCDPTWGHGNWWTVRAPFLLVGSDLDTSKSPSGLSRDATDLPYTDGFFDAVALDPPYKLNGTATDTGGIDRRYGVGGRYASVEGRHRLIVDMVTEAARVVAPATRHNGVDRGGIVLVKVQDQVNGGRVRWQTDMVTRHAETLGLDKVDAFHFVSYRAQPEGRSQQHARRNHSTLLVFRKPAVRRRPAHPTFDLGAAA